MDKSKLLDQCGALGEDRTLLARVLDRAKQASERNIPAATAPPSRRRPPICFMRREFQRQHISAGAAMTARNGRCSCSCRIGWTLRTPGRTAPSGVCGRPSGREKT